MFFFINLEFGNGDLHDSGFSWVEPTVENFSWKREKKDKV